MLDQRVDSALRGLVRGKSSQQSDQISRELRDIVSQFARSGRNVASSGPTLKQACDRELERRAGIIWEDFKRVLSTFSLEWYPEFSDDLKRTMRSYLNETAGELTDLLQRFAPHLKTSWQGESAATVQDQSLAGFYSAEIDLYAAAMRQNAVARSAEGIPNSGPISVWNTSLMKSDKYRFFKYRECNAYTMKSIADSALYAARPDELNDPFDCQVDLRAALDRAARKSTGTRATELTTLIKAKHPIIQNWHTDVQRVGVCAFSLTAPDRAEAAPLWGLYADEYKGVCLVYEFDKSYLDDPRNGYLGIDEVKYGENPVTDWLVAGGTPPSSSEFPTELLKRYLTVKGHRWSHEVEARMLRPTHGEFPIPRGSLVEVYLGLRISEENAKTIESLVSTHTDCKTISKMVHADSDFGLTVEQK